MTIKTGGKRDQALIPQWIRPRPLQYGRANEKQM